MFTWLLNEGKWVFFQASNQPQPPTTTAVTVSEWVSVSVSEWVSEWVSVSAQSTSAAASHSLTDSLTHSFTQYTHSLTRPLPVHGGFARPSTTIPFVIWHLLGLWVYPRSGFHVCTPTNPPQNRVILIADTNYRLWIGYQRQAVYSHSTMYSAYHKQCKVFIRM